MKSLSEILGKFGSYGEKLSTPEWRAFARSIRTERHNSCEICRRGNIQNHVHHLFYDPNLEPWEYGADDVMLLCRGCHRAMHERLTEFRKHVFRGLKPDSFRVLNGALAVGLTEHDPLEFCYAVAEMAASPGSVKRFCAAWHNKKPEATTTPTAPIWPG